MEMLKITAAAVAFAVCAFEGYRRGRALKDRALFLSETEQMLERFSIGIRCAGRTSDELLESEQGKFARLVKEAEGDMRAAWDKACDALPKDREETALLRELGKSFGSADKESTLRLLDSCKSELAGLRKTAEEDSAKRGRAYFQVGTLCGIGIATLII